MSISHARRIYERFAPQVVKHLHLLAFVELDVRLAMSNMWEVSTKTVLETISVDQHATSNSQLLPVQSLRWRDPRMARLRMDPQCKRSYGATYTNVHDTTQTVAYATILWTRRHSNGSSTVARSYHEHGHESFFSFSPSMDGYAKIN